MPGDIVGATGKAARESRTRYELADNPIGKSGPVGFRETHKWHPQTCSVGLVAKEGSQ